MKHVSVVVPLINAIGIATALVIAVKLIAVATGYTGT